MRTTKFRAWDKEKQKYVEPVLIDYAGNTYEVSDKQSDGHSCNVVGNANLQIEQSTGVTDTNGREIHEGDIVKVSPKFEPSVEDIYTGEVFFAIGYGAYMIDFHDYDLNHVLLIPTVVDKRVEVIGNINENEELLNEAKE